MELLTWKEVGIQRAYGPKGGKMIDSGKSVGLTGQHLFKNKQKIRGIDSKRHGYRVPG